MPGEVRCDETLSKVGVGLAAFDGNSFASTLEGDCAIRGEVSEDTTLGHCVGNRKRLK